jgi:hypothetical protein
MGRILRAPVPNVPPCAVQHLLAAACEKPAQAWKSQAKLPGKRNMGTQPIEVPTDLKTLTMTIRQDR